MKVKDRSDDSQPPLPPEELTVVEIRGWRNRSSGYPRWVPE